MVIVLYRDEALEEVVHKRSVAQKWQPRAQRDEACTSKVVEVVSAQQSTAQVVSTTVNSQLVVVARNKGNTMEGQVTYDSSTLVMFGNSSN